MSDLGITTDEAIILFTRIQTEKLFFIIALTLVVYDTILTFSKEVRCIWPRRFGTGTILYLVIRYATILDMIMQIIDASHVSNTIIGCRAVAITSFFVEISSLFAYAAFDCVRIWSICQHEWLPTMLIFVLSMFNPIINMYTNSIFFYGGYLIVPSGPLAACFITTSKVTYIYLGVIARAISVGADAAALGLTLWRTIYIFKVDRAARADNKLITYSLAYNGCIQFGILLVVNIVAMVLDIFSIASDNAALDNASSFIYIQDAITSIILSHFILDLRSVYLTDASGNSTTSSTRSSSLHFVSGVEENLGATVNTPWSSEGMDEGEDLVEEDIQYSEYPFSTGLASIKENVMAGDIMEISDTVPLDTVEAEETEEIELEEIV